MLCARWLNKFEFGEDSSSRRKPPFERSETRRWQLSPGRVKPSVVCSGNAIAMAMDADLREAPSEDDAMRTMTWKTTKTKEERPGPK